MKLLTSGITLQVKGAEDSDWKLLKGLKAVPDLGGQAEQVDVTDLGSTNKEYINGLSDYGTLEFGFFMDNHKDAEGATEIQNAYAALKAYEVAGVSPQFKLTYPGDIGFEWEGTVTIKIVAAEVNAALEFVLMTSLKGEMVIA